MSESSAAPEETPHLLVERSDGVMTLTMNRPEVGNALSPQMLILLARAWYEYRDSADLRVAIFTGAGDKAFCVGGDLKLTMPLMTGARQPEDEWDHALLASPGKFTDGILRGYDIYKPIIAAVNGVAAGGGFEIALACDLIIASDNAFFALPEARVGLVPMAGGMHRLTRQIGLKLGMAMLLTGRRVSAAEGLTLGFVNEVVPNDELMTVARRWASEILEGAPLSVRASKQAMMLGLDEPSLQAALEAQSKYEYVRKMYAHQDVKEGPLAFSQKRKPKWTGW